jgi:hypothetical protein
VVDHVRNRYLGLEETFLSGQNAVWDGATIGAVVGVAIAIWRPGFVWSTVGQSAVMGASASENLNENGRIALNDGSGKADIKLLRF